MQYSVALHSKSSFHRGRQKHSECKWLAKCHTVNQCQCWEKEPESPDSLPYIEQQPQPPGAARCIYSMAALALQGPASAISRLKTHMHLLRQWSSSVQVKSKKWKQVAAVENFGECNNLSITIKTKQCHSLDSLLASKGSPDDLERNIWELKWETGIWKQQR